jgi:hypothetical protein
MYHQLIGRHNHDWVMDSVTLTVPFMPVVRTSSFKRKFVELSAKVLCRRRSSRFAFIQTDIAKAVLGHFPSSFQVLHGASWMGVCDLVAAVGTWDFSQQAAPVGGWSVRMSSTSIPRTIGPRTSSAGAASEVALLAIQGTTPRQMLSRWPESLLV